MRVLIVGCGYVGVPLGGALARQGHEVYGLRRNAEAADKLREAGIEFLRGDITRPVSLPPLTGRFDWVVNCVASGGGTADDYRAVYLEGTRHLLQWLASAPPLRFVYTSSTSVYGQNDGSQVDETSIAAPEAESARVLLATEGLLLDAVRDTGFPAVILRLAGIYGPDRGYWYQQFLQGEARIEGSGSRVLNMVHRDDVIGAISAALLHGGPGQIYNVVDDEPVTQIAYFRWLADTLGRPMPPSVPEEPALRRRGATNKRVSNVKLKSQLGYRFTFPDFRAGYAAEIGKGERQSAH